MKEAIASATFTLIDSFDLGLRKYSTENVFTIYSAHFMYSPLNIYSHSDCLMLGRRQQCQTQSNVNEFSLPKLIGIPFASVSCRICVVDPEVFHICEYICSLYRFHPISVYLFLIFSFDVRSFHPNFVRCLSASLALVTSAIATCFCFGLWLRRMYSNWMDDGIFRFSIMKRATKNEMRRKK